MISTLAGIPAGYGYFEETAPAGENIIPDVMTAIRENNPGDTPVAIQTMTIQVKAASKVSVNNRPAVLVTPDTGLSFDVRGTVFSLVFESAVAYNLAFSY